MELSVASLQEAGAFTGAPVEKEIKWKQDGKEMVATAYVRKLSYRSAVADTKQIGKDVVAGRIASCICDKKGMPVFTVADITGDDNIERGPLNHELTIALLCAIAEVNGYTEKKTKA